MNNSVCIDAGLALDWLLPSKNSEAIDRLWKLWKETGARIVTAPLFYVEVTSAIRGYVYSKKLLSEEGEMLFLECSAMPLDIVRSQELSGTAWKLARRYNLPRTYDTQYLAAAELEDCELVTADERLFAGLKGKTGRVKWVGDESLNGNSKF